MWIEYIGAETGFRKIEKLESLTYDILGVYINGNFVNTKNPADAYKSIREALQDNITIMKLEDISREDMNKILGSDIHV